MKKLLLLLFVSLCAIAHAQHSTPERKALQAKKAMYKAFGGKKALKRISHFSYTIERTAYGADTTFTRTSVVLDLTRQHIRETQYTSADTITRWIGEDGAWVLEKGRKAILPEKEQQRLQHTFVTNFIPMLRNDSLVYQYKTHTVYKGRQAAIIQVYTPGKEALVFDLFVDSVTGEILTSSRPDPITGDYVYFADELDYQPVQGGIIFPLVYQVWVNGRLVSEGRFKELQVSAGKKQSGSPG